MGSGLEYTHAELPTIEQLQKMRQLPGGLGWEYIEANHLAAIPEQRDNYHEVLLLPRLQRQLREINPDPQRTTLARRTPHQPSHQPTAKPWPR
ncbi:hypothetical protein NSTCB13_06328 [Nostoc sp. DSM 114160]|jgi:hypothetical protein